MKITQQMVEAANAVVPSLTEETVRTMLQAAMAANPEGIEQLMCAGLARVLLVVDRPSSDLYRKLREAAGEAARIPS